MTTRANSGYMTAAIFEWTGLWVRLYVRDRRIWVERMESAFPSSMGRVFEHQPPYVYLGRSRLAPPWQNRYLMLERSGQTALVPLTFTWEQEVIEEIKAEGFEVIEGRDWIDAYLPQSMRTRRYLSKLEKLRGGGDS